MYKFLQCLKTIKEKGPTGKHIGHYRDDYNIFNNDSIVNAIIYGRLTMAYMLIDAGFSVDRDQYDTWGYYTPLHISISNGDYAMTKCLLDKGAKLSCPRIGISDEFKEEYADNDPYYLLLAVLHNRPRIAKLLSKYYGNITFSHGTFLMKYMYMIFRNIGSGGFTWQKTNLIIKGIAGLPQWDILQNKIEKSRYMVYFHDNIKNYIETLPGSPLYEECRVRFERLK